MSNSMFYIGLSGLNAAQASLLTAGHNSANFATPGYSRQTAVVGSGGGTYAPSVGFFGNGAAVTNVVRSYDQYLTSQLNQAQGTNEALSTFFSQVSQIDNLLANQTAGLAPLMQTFFTSVQGVANTPSDPAARQQMVSAAQAVANQYRSMSLQLNDMNSGVNQQISGNVDQINTLADQIANINKQITLVGGVDGTQAPNDLLDQRDQMVSDLGKLVATKVVVQDGGQYNVFIGNGQTLVLGAKASTLQVVNSAADPSRSAVAVINANGKPVEMQDSVLTGGSLGGLLQFRNEALGDAQNSLGRIAISLADTFNAQHKLGVDLSGALGQDFFSQASPSAISNDRNKGDMKLAPTFSDVGQLTTSDYTLTVSGAPGALAYSLTRLSDNKVINTYSDADFPVTFDGVTMAIGSGKAQSGDSFLIQPTRNGGRDLSVIATDPAKLAAANPVLTGNVAGNQGTGVISAPVIDAAYLNAPLTGTTTLTYDKATNTLTGFPSNASVSVTSADGTTQIYNPGTPVPYTAGAKMRFDGVSISITGSPSTGDQFTLKPNSSGVSDGSNALLLGALQSKKTMNAGTASFNDSYSQLVSSVGNKTRQVQIASTAQTSLTAQIKAAQQSVSGVNQDEETANLLMFQQMYQANAKVIQTASTMFDAVLGIHT
ncbi:flagellar hook-associated protein FlgK [Glaciimonas sp. Gout2]|uniref:flagellar hook-associated protein FlgK n=2 Tax=Glaciimonas TaxID=1229970 RepID=UPI002AB34073|nr:MULTISPECIES: flagellar hook-associated protein FlgK [unclassified Glaciimonas]MDY7548728.1 flagellar hook-associated protein FlgK [Glaciimonas sp. CA11.2]MEB0013888.1 flagellar hook-associated protein FlgK [Glaciimonas sp. Cout2]MEB0083823.1 flagellar hook-associated protein FlgK [Glaciimonas sp. Gout2]